MGAFSKRNYKDIVLPNPDDTKGSAAFRKKWGWDPHEQVILRGRPTAGMQRAITNATSSFDNEGNIATTLGNGRNIMLKEMIASWTFTDDNGIVLPIDDASIDDLPPWYSTPILQACDRIMKGMSPKEQESFLASANGHSPTNSDVTSLAPMPS